MDKIDKKLLLVVDQNKAYKSVISVGDIQRYLIKTQNLNASIKDVLRVKIRVAQSSREIKEIKAEMLKFRMEFMPILDEDNVLVDVVFWEDLFEEKYIANEGNLEIPVIIMAGGKGTRLKPITNVIPKPLIPLGDKTILERIIDRFLVSGAKHFYLSVNYKSEMIQNYFSELKEKKYQINFFEENKPLGTAGSLSLLTNKINSTLFVSNCDILIDQDFEKMYQYHLENKNELTLIGALKTSHIPYGILEVGKDNLLKEIKEKPELNFMVNTGVYIIEPHVLNEIPKDTFFHITHLMEKIIKRNGRVGVFPIGENSWMDVGNWSEYNETLKKLGETPFV
ncbi:MAG: NTP transferase domain-containing protein [Flavobacteriaceae bacterium]|nr:NTP transferase domain-containing protein [Flavobacteriaceae bacterium]